MPVKLMPFGKVDEKWGDKAGDMLSYAGNYYTAIEWRENIPFQAKMKIIRYERGRSAARFILEDTEGHTYPMFLSNMVEILTSVGVEPGGYISGMWQGVKKGANYGLQLIPEYK